MQNTINYYKLNKSIHRDLGYFFVFLTLIYSISGLAINHIHDWNPDFYVRKKSINHNLPKTKSEINETIVKNELERLGESGGFLMFDFPTDDKLKVYFKDGSIMFYLAEQTAELERVSKRHVLFEMNYIHRNPGGLWTIISDIFAISLIILSLSGLFILKGKQSLKRRGKWLVGSGVIVTIVFFLAIIY
jgi:hypothetical protein